MPLRGSQKEASLITVRLLIPPLFAQIKVHLRGCDTNSARVKAAMQLGRWLPGWEVRSRVANHSSILAADKLCPCSQYASVVVPRNPIFVEFKLPSIVVRHFPHM
jgi:hypothetical protein